MNNLFSRNEDIILKRTNEGATANIPQEIVRHSPTGFEWGYGGSGPADLALNILAQYVPRKLAESLHQQYKWDVIARIPHEGTTITSESVRAWIKNHLPETLADAADPAELETLKARRVTIINVTDPLTGEEIELRVFKDPESLALFAVESSYLDNVETIIVCPYNSERWLECGEDVEHPSGPSGHRASGNKAR